MINTFIIDQIVKKEKEERNRSSSVYQRIEVPVPDSFMIPEQAISNPIKKDSGRGVHIIDL